MRLGEERLTGTARRRDQDVSAETLTRPAGDGLGDAGRRPGQDRPADAARWLDEDEMRAWQSFLAAGALVDRRVDQQLK
jgi:hypothetical protein